MPSKSPKQLRLIYAKRNQYKTKKNAPKAWKWVFNDEWLHLKESYIITSFSEFIKRMY